MINKYWQIILFFTVITQALAATAATVTNGGFEDGIKNWSYEEWKGLPPPGRSFPLCGERHWVGERDPRRR